MLRRCVVMQTTWTVRKTSIGVNCQDHGRTWVPKSFFLRNPNRLGECVCLGHRHRRRHPASAGKALRCNAVVTILPHILLPLVNLNEFKMHIASNTALENAIVGGLIVGTSSAAFMYLNGRITGLSGIARGMVGPDGED
eukprot:gene13122-15141_t